MPATIPPHAGRTVLIVGVGRFGRNYVTALSQLVQTGLNLPQAIARVVITKKDGSAATRLARRLADEKGPLGFELIGHQAENEDQLGQLLQTYRPCLSCITARDPFIGDTIHALYAAVAAPYGPVLTEKPFSQVTGDGGSLTLLERLSGQTLGMELPMAVVRQAMESLLDLGQLFAGAQRVIFEWGKPEVGPVDLISELFLHPWSLIPPKYTLHIQEVQNGKQRARIEAQLMDRQSPRGNGARCTFHFYTGSRQRMLQIDGNRFGFTFRDNRLRVALRAPAKAAPAQSPYIEVTNPLAQHLLAMLQGQPIVDLHQIHEAQLILERLFGYQSAGKN